MSETKQKFDFEAMLLSSKIFNDWIGDTGTFLVYEIDRFGTFLVVVPGDETHDWRLLRFFLTGYPDNLKYVVSCDTEAGNPLHFVSEIIKQTLIEKRYEE